MRRRSGICLAIIAAVSIAVITPAAQVSAPAAVAGQQPNRAAPRASVAAYLLVDLSSGRRLAVRREDVLRQVVSPGAIAKIATLVAALESGAVAPTQTFVCRRKAVLAEGETIACVHPSLGRPMTLAEALAHSCNATFAAIASRLRRDDLDNTLRSLGLSATDPTVPVTVAALGLRGVRGTPEQLLTAFVRAVGAAAPGLPASAAIRVSDASRRTVIEGARGAADYGSAAVLKAHAVSALAKTGIVPMSGGRNTTLIVALAPAAQPTVGVVVVAPGGAGIDAAGVAADRLQEALVRPAVEKVEPVPEAQVRVGRARASGRYEVETIGLEEYVARAVAAQGAAGIGLEARKALAISARTFALANRDRHRADGFDVCDLAHCQVTGRATSMSRQATEATRGQVLRVGQNVASVYYTASCGGQTDRPTQVWKGVADAAYLPSRAEDECRLPSRWTSELPSASVARALRSAGMRGQEIRNLWVRSRTPAGRVARVAASGFEPQEIDGEAFRLAIGRTLGWHLLKSTHFNVTRTAAGYRFDGHGAGAGVGLCVMGAGRAGAAGATAESILASYFPGTTIGAAAVADPRVEITVPAGAERERQLSVDLTRRWLKEYAARLSVPPPPAVSLVFHPTVESYLRATGQPWWTGGTTQGTRVDLLPPAVLRQRSAFERTLRHEVAHLVIAERLRDRPLWVREAAAMYVSSEIPLLNEAVQQAGLTRSPACPTDEEMRRFESAEAMREAHARAAACYVEQLVAGKKWDEIK